jgi:hypothetical protein
MAIGNAIWLMCRATKSREGDHLAAAIGLRSLQCRCRLTNVRVGVPVEHG